MKIELFSLNDLSYKYVAVYYLNTVIIINIKFDV